MKSSVRVIVPDVHGAHRNVAACDAVVRDVKRLDPDELVLLGDLVDCAGVFSRHARSFTNEIEEAYGDDCDAANLFLDQLQKAAPRAKFHLAEGNHELRVEKFAANIFSRKRDADTFLDVMGPEKALDLRGRGIRYYRQGQTYQGLPIPGTFRLGKVFFTHGIGHSANATALHLSRFGASVVHGHTHRAMSVISRTVTSDCIGAWCPGTLSELQPLYMHTTPTTWSSGFAVQFIAPGGKFLHLNIPIAGGESMLLDVARRVA